MERTVEAGASICVAVVANTARSLVAVGADPAAVERVLGFAVDHTVPDAAPYVFASVRSGAVEIFLNAPEPAIADYPAFANRPIGGTLTLFIETSGIAEAYESLRARVKVVMPLEKKWYGVTEFAFEDPDGYVITFAERHE